MSTTSKLYYTNKFVTLFLWYMYLSSFFLWFIFPSNSSRILVLTNIILLNFFPPYINNISTRKSSWYDTTQQRITIDRRTADFVQNTVIHYTEHHCLKSLIMCWGKECIPEMIKYIIVKWVKLTWNGWTRTINQFKSFLCSIIWTQIIVML